MTKPLNILLLSKYGRLGASTRLRSLQYIPYLKQCGIHIHWQQLISDAELSARYKAGGYRHFEVLQAYARRLRAMHNRRAYDAVIIEKEALPWAPLWVERAMLGGVPYILDYDDAIFHNYDRHRLGIVRRLYGRRLDGLMAKAALMIGGNSYLAQRAKDAGTRRVAVLPTAIDLDRYQVRDTALVNTPPRIVWIGSPSTVAYLNILREPLQQLAQTTPFVLRIIGGGAIDLPGVQTEVVTWAEATEVQSIRSCDIGIMPLLDTPWEAGKCGYKLIQYMACGLPVVGSDIGVNPDIVPHGQCGYLASTPQQWLAALTSLLQDPALRQRLGQAGRNRVEQHYCIQQTGPRLAELIRSVLVPRDNV